MPQVAGRARAAMRCSTRRPPAASIVRRRPRAAPVAGSCPARRPRGSPTELGHLHSAAPFGGAAPILRFDSSARHGHSTRLFARLTLFSRVVTGSGSVSPPSPAHRSCRCQQRFLPALGAQRVGARSANRTASSRSPSSSATRSIGARLPHALLGVGRCGRRPGATAPRPDHRSPVSPRMATLIGLRFDTVALERRCRRLPWGASGVKATLLGRRSRGSWRRSSRRPPSRWFAPSLRIWKTHEGDTLLWHPPPVRRAGALGEP